ncbi:MAG: efflux transporter outer membrane subunit [Alphaproteobacteria bacterium]|nr:efflux transporter outer membrane subunit [Alphaproteobacteria bacterium]
MARASLPRLAALLLSGAALSACAGMAPKYHRPIFPAPDILPYADQRTGEEAALVGWRDVFTDPKLQALIKAGLENNRDYRVAILNVEKARALYHVQRSALVPNVDATAGYSRQRLGPNASTGVVGRQTAGGGTPTIIEQYNVSGVVSSYELDLFGRVRSLNKQALETYFATREARKAAKVTLVSEIANAYFALAADRELLAIAEQTYKSQQASLELTQQLVDNGVGTDLDVSRARTSIESARADAARLRAQVDRDENALRLLVGAPPPGIEEERRLADIALRRDIPAGVKSDILLGRPDVLEAEDRLKAANANIGAARAAFFPQILLTTSAGTASADLTDLFAPGAGVWRFAPQINLPIFAGGRNLAQLKGARVDRDIAMANYEKAIESAFRDVADALATRQTIDEQLDATVNLAKAAAKTFELAQMRFKEGVDSYLSVLDAQRADYSARQQLVAARLAEASNVAALYAALGGGFDENDQSESAR